VNETYPVKILPHRVHPTLKDCETLFGVHEADKLRQLTAKDYKPANLYVSLTGPRGVLKDIPLYHPLSQEKTQIMITLSDARHLGVNAPICVAPCETGSPGLSVAGSAGSLALSSGVHIPQRRLCIRPQRTIDPHLREGDLTFVAPVMSKLKPQSNGSRVLIFGDVFVQYSADCAQGFYLDEEEAAAGNLENGDLVRILGKPVRPEYRSDAFNNRRKRLITENDVRQAIMSGEKITVEQWMMLTPAARDLGNAHKVLIFQD